MGRLVIFYLVPLILTIFCLVDAITSRDGDVRRHLPERRLRAGERPAPEFPEYDRPSRRAQAVGAGRLPFAR